MDRKVVDKYTRALARSGSSQCSMRRCQACQAGCFVKAVEKTTAPVAGMRAWRVPTGKSCARASICLIRVPTQAAAGAADMMSRLLCIDFNGAVAVPKAKRL